VLVFGSIAIAATLLAGTAMISHGVRFGWLYLCAMQVPAGAYDVVTHQYGFVAVSFVGGWLYWRGWRIRSRWLVSDQKNQSAQVPRSECALFLRYGYCPHCDDREARYGSSG
jgi:membrane protein implicated in regulation of membrane protease activity